MKKNKKEFQEPITIYNYDALEHERLDDVKINLKPKDEVASEKVLIIIAIIVKVLQYISLLVFEEQIKVYVFSGLLFISFAFLVLSRLSKTKWMFSKLIASLFLIFLLLDIAIILLII